MAFEIPPQPASDFLSLTGDVEADAFTGVTRIVSADITALGDIDGLSVLGRAPNSTGPVDEITATAGSQHLVSNAAGTALEWVSSLSTQFDDTVTGTLDPYLLPEAFKSGDSLVWVLTGNTVLNRIRMFDDSIPEDGTWLFLSVRDQSGGVTPGWTLTLPDTGAVSVDGSIRPPGQVQGTSPGPSYIMQSEEEGCTMVIRAGNWRLTGGTAAQAVEGDILIAAGNGGTRTAAIAPGVIVNADVSASAAIDQTKLGATTGFSVKASGSAATTSAEPIVTFSASSNMSNERVTTSSTSVTVSTSVASQIEFQRAALSGAIAAPANTNTTQFSGIRVDGVATTDRTNINFIAGANVTLTPSDDAGSDEIEITIASTGGGGGGTVTPPDGINLTATDHTLEVVISGGGVADWEASFVDMSAGTEGSTTSNNFSAATTTTVSAPGASVQRVVVHANLYCITAGTFTIQKDVAGTDVILIGPLTLAVGERVEFTAAAGWQTFNADGSNKSSAGPAGADGVDGVDGVDGATGATGTNAKVQSITASVAASQATTNLSFGSYTMQVAEMVAGSVWRCTGHFTLVKTANTNVAPIIELLVGGVVVATATTTSIGSTAETISAKVEAFMTIKTTGAAGTIDAFIGWPVSFDMGDSSLDPVGHTPTVDTTSTKTLEMRIRMANVGSTPTNTLTVRQGFYEKL
jgi:hypothetical protein